MKEVLINLLNNSRSDYFNFPVSAAIVCTNNRVFYGVNVETSSPQAGICAERNALYNAFTNGIKKEDIKEIHVMSKNGVVPCFICRQAFADFCDMDVKVVIYSLDGKLKEMKLSDFCVNAFSKGDLE